MKTYQISSTLPFLILLVAGCAPSHAPGTSASDATRQATKAEQGTIVSVRAVGPMAAQVAAMRGTLAAGIATEQAAAGTLAFEYIVRKPAGEVISVTQRDRSPLMAGQPVVVMTGKQARVVADATAGTAAMVTHVPAAATYAGGSSAVTPW